MMLAVIRLRGKTKLRHDHKKALEVLGLHATNHLALVDDKDLGLVQAVSDYVAYGPVDAEWLAALLEKRGRLAGNQRLTAEWLASANVKSFSDAANTLMSNRKAFEATGLKRIFRLGSPRKGLGTGGKKTRVAFKGSLGNWGPKIQQLVYAMM